MAPLGVFVLDALTGLLAADAPRAPLVVRPAEGRTLDIVSSVAEAEGGDCLAPMIVAMTGKAVGGFCCLVLTYRERRVVFCLCSL